MNAHKDTQHPAGQTRATEQELKGQQTLSDYIRFIKHAEAFDAITAEKKLTFTEWWTINGQGGNHLFEIAKEAWNAALKHGKVS